MGSNPISRSIFFFLIPIFLSAFTIEESYFIDKRRVFTTDVFPVEKKLLLFEFNNRTTKQYPKTKIIEALKKKGIDATSKFDIIFFYRISPELILDLKDRVSELYEGNENLTVTRVNLKPQSMRDLKDLELLSVDIKQNNLKRSRGVGKAHFGVEGENLVSMNFSYSVEGVQKVLVASRKIERGEVIDKSNTKVIELPIKQRVLEYIDQSLLGSYEARVAINKELIIDKRRVVKSFAVRKGEKVNAQIIEGGIILDFKLIARKNGYIGETIELENKRRKKFYGVITAKGKVEIE